MRPSKTLLTAIGDYCSDARKPDLRTMRRKQANIHKFTYKGRINYG